MNRRYFSGLAVGVLIVILALVVAGCGSSNKKSNGASSADVNSAGLDTNGCKPMKRPPAKTVKLPKPNFKLDPNKRNLAIFHTNCGDFTVLLDAKHNPKTAASMAYLVKKGVYDNTWFHRIVKDFVIQGGDPLGDGTGDAGYRVVEKPHGNYAINTVAMAKGPTEGAGTSGSQFYVVTGAQGAQLIKDYAIAGKIAANADTIARIAGYAADSQNGTPVEVPAGVAVITHAELKIK